MEMPPDTFLVGYANDNVAVTMAGNTDDAQISLNQVMRRTGSWLGEYGLDLAIEKTERVLLLSLIHI